MPGADHQRRLHRVSVRQARAVQGHRGRLQHCRLGKGETVRQFIKDALRHRDILRKRPGAPVVSTGDAQHLAVIAEVYLASTAVGALAAINRGVKGHAVSNRKARHSLAQRGDRSRRPHAPLRWEGFAGQTSRRSRARRCRRCRMPPHGSAPRRGREKVVRRR